jgi:DNA-binding NarL/FixJ family response regulator
MRYPAPNRPSHTAVATELSSPQISAPTHDPAETHPSSIPDTPSPSVRSHTLPAAIRVLIVDDHTLMREGLVQLFASEKDLQVVGEAADGFSALEQIRLHQPDVVLMDIHLPIIDGVTLTRQITQLFPHVAVIILSMYHQQQQVVEAIRSGARGYLLKNTSSQEVTQAIRSVHSGAAVITPMLTEALVEEIRNQPDTTPDGRSIAQLSSKELEIIRYLATGMSNREIAERLIYSEKTVKNYLSTIFQKLHLRDRTQVAIFALRHGLLPTENNESSYHIQPPDVN